MKSKPKHSKCKKGAAKRANKALLKRCEIKMGGQGLLLLIELKFLIIMASLQNSVISGAQGPWCWWDQNFDKDDQAAKMKEQCFAV